ncbi:hypothetical protein ACUNHE_12505, partial [Serratia sp. IR-2025]
RLIRCVCGKKIGPDPRNFNQRVSLGRNDLLIRTFPKVTLLFIGIALVLAGVYFFTERYDTAYQTQIASYKSCRVETLNASERIDERYIADALEMLKSRGFDCDVPATVYYSQLTYHYTNYKKLIDFISYCPKHRVKNMDAHCEDEFEVINEG